MTLNWGIRKIRLAQGRKRKIRNQLLITDIEMKGVF
jgi:exonuclease III